MEWLNNWWAQISAVERIFWFIAMPSSVILILQLILEFIGSGSHDADVNFDADANLDVDVNMDADVDAHHGIGHDSGAGLRIFTIKGFVIFFTLFGWTGVTFTRTGIPVFITVFIALIIGFASMIFVAWVFKTLYGLSESGSMQVGFAIGHRGTVYLTIPAEGQGKGQIQLKLQGATQTLDAVTYENQPIKTGTNVKVTEVLEDNTLVVVNDLTIE